MDRRRAGSRREEALVVVEKVEEGLWQGEEWLCRLLVHRSCCRCCCCCCVSSRHSPASPRHEPRRKGVLLYAQLLRKFTAFLVCTCVTVLGGGMGRGVCVLGDAREGCGGLRAAAVMKSSAYQRLLHYCHQSRCLSLQLEGMQVTRAVIDRCRQEYKV